MSRIPLSIATLDYDRTRPLKDGVVQPRGIALDYRNMTLEEILRRQCLDQEFDVSEMSFAAHLVMLSRLDPPFIAIPVFISRFFRHSMVYVNRNAGIENPEDLRGKRIGIPDWWVTAIVLLKGTWQEHYGVHPREIRWFVGGLDKPGRKELIDVRVPADVTVELISEDTTLSDMLERGEIDAIFAARDPECVRRGSKRVGRLFSDPKSVEIAYYQRTGIFPIMHLIVLRRSLHEQYPWMVDALFTAFQEAKALAEQVLRDSGTLRYMLPWLHAAAEESWRVLGPDPWKYGVEPNRVAIETFARYCHEQGLTPRPYRAEEIFARGAVSQGGV